MRIIAGSARGRTLIAPKGLHTRPTLDHVRESLFNIIQRDVPGAVVLDLFAGSGALGLEALSRGARQAVLVDKARQAMDCIRRNVEMLRAAEQALLRQGDWQAVLMQLDGIQFDLVFLDPPYKLVKYREMAALLVQRNLLNHDALLVIEHQKNVAIALPPEFLLRDVRTYGDTQIHLFRFSTGGNTDGE